jgi:hypothetical protein
MAMTVESFQRFETKKLVGKTYPWLAQHQVESKSLEFKRTLSATSSPYSPIVIQTNSKINNIHNKNNIQKDNNTNAINTNVKSMKDDINNFDDTKKPELTKDFQRNITDDDKIIQAATQNVYEAIPDNDTIENIHEIREYLKSMESIDYVEINEEENLDQVPTLPPPPRPTSTKHPYLEKLHRLSQYKDMLIHNTESFIKENIPRLPSKYFEHPINEKEIKTSPPVSPTSFSNDDIDAVLLPTRRKLAESIEEDDIVAKFISFLGWLTFLLMRMLSLSVFAVFYPEICGYICLGHYLLMLFALINETRFNVKWQRTAFYFILAYIYIFNLMEFKVKFKKVRRWYVWYFILVFSQNISMTIAWYGFTDFLDTWWFEFMFLSIIQSGLMSLMCFILYFYYLKPNEKLYEVKILEDDDKKS